MTLRERGAAVGVDIPSWIEKAEGDTDRAVQGLEVEGDNLDEVGIEAGATMSELVEDEWWGLGRLAAGSVGEAVKFIFTQVGDEFREAGDRAARYADSIGETATEIERALTDLEEVVENQMEIRDKIERLKEAPEDECDARELASAREAARFASLSVTHQRTRVDGLVDDAEALDRFHGDNIAAAQADVDNSMSRLSTAFGALRLAGDNPHRALVVFATLHPDAVGDSLSIPPDRAEDLEEIADRTGQDPEDILEALEALEDDGFSDGDPTYFYIEWVGWTLSTGLSPTGIVERAEQFGVQPDTFDVLDGLRMVRDPDGRPYFVVEGSGEAREIVRITELLNGGDPIETDERRDANSWSMNGDVPLVLNTGGALIATPEGIFMGMGGNLVMDWFSAKGGTTWGEIFMVNGNPDDPEQALIDIIESGSTHEDGDPTLDRLLHHERIHSEQWARYGYLDFIARYLDASTDVELRTKWVPWPLPFGSWITYPVIVERDPCFNEYEQEAGLEDGGYHCD